MYQSGKGLRAGVRIDVRTDPFEDVVGHITGDIVYSASRRVRPDDGCAGDIERMSSSVIRSMGEVNEHSEPEQGSLVRRLTGVRN
jgi:hypothetical protein